MIDPAITTSPRTARSWDFGASGIGNTQRSFPPDVDDTSLSHFFLFHLVKEAALGPLSPFLFFISISSGNSPSFSLTSDLLLNNNCSWEMNHDRHYEPCCYRRSRLPAAGQWGL